MALGALIGASFGLVFVLVNSGAPVPGSVAAVLSLLAVAALAATIALITLTRQEYAIRGSSSTGRRAGGAMFGTGYKVVVAAEVVLIFGGFPVLRQLDAPTQANVAWIATVVGLHFVVLAAVWKQSSIAGMGAVLTVLGVGGLVMTATTAVEWVPLVSGTISGLVLLAGSVAATAREYAGVRT